MVHKMESKSVRLGGEGWWGGKGYYYACLYAINRSHKAFACVGGVADHYTSLVFRLVRGNKDTC